MKQGTMNNDMKFRFLTQECEDNEVSDDENNKVCFNYF